MVQLSPDHFREFFCCHVWDKKDGELQLLNVCLLSYEGEHLQPHWINSPGSSSRETGQ